MLRFRKQGFSCMVIITELSEKFVDPVLGAAAGDIIDKTLIASFRRQQHPTVNECPKAVFER